MGKEKQLHIPRGVGVTAKQVAPPPKDPHQATFVEVYRSFAILDLSGFSKFVKENGGEVAAQELMTFRKLLNGVAGRRSVRIDKWLGDGAMLVGTNLPSMVSAVVELEYWYEQQSLPLRAGISAGTALLLDGADYVSEALNKASRLCDLACSEHTVLLEKPYAPRSSDIPEWVDVKEKQVLTIKGYPDPIHVLSLTPGNWEYANV